MQDRFKMRAWDENNKIMHYDFQFIKSGDNGNDWIIFQSDKQELDFDKEKNFCVNVYPNPYFAQQLKIMQCTGLKDKNGNLIYEEDIIKEYYYNTKKTAIKKIIFDENTCGYAYTDSIEYNSLCFSDCRRLEIIGNIYQNPELLQV